VIGGGPAGLMAAEMLATAGARVTVFERMPSVGRKFLLAGRGGLNLTHAEDFASFRTRYGAAAEWLTPALEAFPPAALRAWCHGLGVETFVGSSGRVFPVAMKTSPLLRAWLARLRALGVVIETRQLWTGWDAAGRLRLRGPEGERGVAADATVLALGGGSWPRLGSDGGWAEVLTRAGVAVTPLRPANCGFVCAWSARFRDGFAGAPLKAIRAEAEGLSARGDAVITGYGIEGGAIYALSAGLRERIARDGAATLTLDLRPDQSAAVLAARLARVRARESLSNVLRRGANLSPVAVHLLREDPAPLPRASALLAARIKAVRLTLTAPQPLARAISTAGGVAQDGLDAGFMVRKLPGVFVAGEMLEWEAPTGGYLLQASLATGRAAGLAASRFVGGMG
jgi:uncharacterized flavoprotein (TIGR03862 family)